MPVAVPIGKQHQHIRKQIRQGVQAIRHQGLRVRKKTAHHLQGGQQHIDGYTDPGAFLRGGKTFRIHRFKSPDLAVGLMRIGVIIHFGYAGMLL